MNKITTFFLTIFLGLYFSASAQIDNYQTDIVSLLNVNGTFQEYDFEFEKILVSLRVRIASANTPPSFWEKQEEGKKKNVDELISTLAFAYRKHFTHPEIIELLAYYKTSAAQKILTNEKVFTEEELEIINTYNTSAIAHKVNNKQEELAADVLDIFNEWKREEFKKGMGALAKAGYTK